jgi:hypothetical protein
MHEVLFRESRFRYPRAPSEGPLGSRPDTHSQAWASSHSQRTRTLYKFGLRTQSSTAVLSKPAEREAACLSELSLYI